MHRLESSDETQSADADHRSQSILSHTVSQQSDIAALKEPL